MNLPRLPKEALDEIFVIVSALQLDRTALWQGLESVGIGVRPLRSTVDNANNYSAQLMIDLGVLNLTGQLPQGPDPLLRWLDNAILLTDPRPQVLRLKHCRNLLLSAGSAHAPDSPPPTTSAVPSPPTTAGTRRLNRIRANRTFMLVSAFTLIVSGAYFGGLAFVFCAASGLALLVLGPYYVSHFSHHSDGLPAIDAYYTWHFLYPSELLVFVGGELRSFASCGHADTYEVAIQDYRYLHGLYIIVERGIFVACLIRHGSTLLEVRKHGWT